jgi:hypothetical protein
MSSASSKNFGKGLTCLDGGRLKVPLLPLSAAAMEIVSPDATAEDDDDNEEEDDEDVVGGEVSEVLLLRWRGAERALGCCFCFVPPLLLLLLLLLRSARGLTNKFALLTLLSTLPPTPP